MNAAANCRPAAAMLAAVLVAAVTAAPVANAQEPGLSDQPAALRTVRGTLECRTLEGGAPCGTDTFTLTAQADGTRTLAARAELAARGIQLDVVLRVDRDFRPLEAFTQSYSGGNWLGTGLFLVAGPVLKATVRTPERIVTEELPVPERFSLLLHPVAADGWHFGHYDRQKGGRQMLPRCAVGAARESVRCALADTALEFLGEETLTVPAGTFQTERYRFGEATEVWLTGPDRVVVQHEYRTFGIRYQLTRIDGLP